MSDLGEESPFLDDATEAEWALLHDQFDLAEGFWIGWLFSQTFTAPRVMAERSVGKLRAAGRALRLWQPESPTALREVTAHLVAAARESSTDCLWVEALTSDAPNAAPDASWRIAWQEFLMRTNERREVFVRHHRGGLVFVGPLALKGEAQERSPDLWAYRSIVIEFVEARPTPRVPALEIEPLEPEPPAAESSTATLDDAERSLANASRFTVAWRVVMQASAALREAGQVTDARRILIRLLALPHDDQTPRAWVGESLAALATCEVRQGDVPAAIDHFRTALRYADEVDDDIAAGWCWQLTELLESQLDLKEALEIAERGLVRARRAGATRSNARMMGNVSLFLDLVGTLRLAGGSIDGAEAAYTESLELRRRLLTLRGEVPEALRHLSIGLERVGNIRQARGDLVGAESAYAESLELRRRLLTLRGEVPEALRDLAIGLERVGKVRQAHGDLAGAESAYLESLELSRRLLTLRGEVPEALRDLSIGLSRVGGLRQARGDLVGAESAYAESLELRRRLLTLRGEVPEALRDLSIGLESVGNVRQARGDLVGAESAHAESLELRRRLLTLRGEVPEALRDLAIGLERVGKVRQARDDLAGAESAYKESLELSRRLLTLRGEVPEALRDLSIDLRSVGGVRVARRDLVGAESAYKESLELTRRLRTLRGEVPEALRDHLMALAPLAYIQAMRDDGAYERTRLEAKAISIQLRALEKAGVYVGPIPKLPPLRSPLAKHARKGQAKGRRK